MENSLDIIRNISIEETIYKPVSTISIEGLIENFSIKRSSDAHVHIRSENKNDGINNISCFCIKTEITARTTDKSIIGHKNVFQTVSMNIYNDPSVNSILIPLFFSLDLTKYPQKDIKVEIKFEIVESTKKDPIVIDSVDYDMEIEWTLVRELSEIIDKDRTIEDELNVTYEETENTYTDSDFSEEQEYSDSDDDDSFENSSETI